MSRKAFFEEPVSDRLIAPTVAVVVKYLCPTQHSTNLPIPSAATALASKAKYRIADIENNRDATPQTIVHFLSEMRVRGIEFP